MQKSTYAPLVNGQVGNSVPAFLKQVAFRQTPSLFFFWPKDTAFAAAAWIGIVFACLTLTGLADRYSTWFSMLVWAVLWVLYLSFVNVGQIFYGFGSFSSGSAKA